MARMSIGAAERQLFGLICCVPRDTPLPNLNETTIEDETEQNGDRHAFLIAMAVAAACCVVSLIVSVILLLHYAIRKHRVSRSASPYYQALVLSAGRTYNALQDSSNESETAFLNNEVLQTSPVSINQIYRKQMTTQLRERCSSARNVYWFIILCDALQSCVFIVRSAMWISRAFAVDLHYGNEIDSAHVFCSLSLAAFNFFFVASCAWSVAYSIDVYRCLNLQSTLTAFYHSLCWALPLALCTTAEVLLYSPNFDKSCPDVSNVLSVLPQYLVPHFVALFSILTLLCLRLAVSQAWKQTEKIEKQVLDEVDRDLQRMTQRLTGQTVSVTLLSLPYLAWVTATTIAYQNPAIPFDDSFALIYAYSACFGLRSVSSVLFFVLDVKSRS